MDNCQPTTECGAQYVQEVVAPSGPTNCDGPPDGSDISAAVAKTRDQVVVAKPTFIEGTWDFITFLTPYYAQQVVVVAYPTGQDTSIIRPLLRNVINSIPTPDWWAKQLPAWHDPNDYVIFDDQGDVMGGPFNFAVGWSCPRILRELMAPLTDDVQLIRMVREVRRWGRYMTISPVANATQLKGRIVSSSLQFNSALNPLKTLNSTPGQSGEEFQSFQPTWTASSLSGQYFDGVTTYQLQSTGEPSTTISNVYPFDIYDMAGELVIPASTVHQVTLLWLNLNSGNIGFTMSLSGQPIATVSGISPVFVNLQVRGDVPLPNVTISDTLARYTITPDFAFSALQQADDKSYTANYIEGVFSRQAYGKGHLDYTSTREWRPLVRSGTSNSIKVTQVGIKYDLVDLSGKWHIDYCANIDPEASFALVYGTHYQFCAETDQPFQLFKKPPPELDDGALQLAKCLQVALPHSYPAKFNDGGILPSLLKSLVSVGRKAIPGVVRALTGSIATSIREVGTSDRLIGYPSQYVAYGGNSPQLLDKSMPFGNGNGTNRIRDKSARNGNGTLQMQDRSMRGGVINGNGNGRRRRRQPPIRALRGLNLNLA